MSQISLFEAINEREPVTQPVPRMVNADVARRQFISEFNHTARNHHRWEVFRDFISLVASELDLARIRTPENLEKSKKTCARYTPKDIEQFHKLFNLLITALEGKFHDFLGSVFMELELGSDSMGQFFTPYHLSHLMARLSGSDIAEQLKKMPFVTFDEPASGAGGMIIAFAETMLEAGFNPAEQLFVSCTDLDPLAADMAFIQLGLLGIPAQVKTGNTLSQETHLTRYTPVYYINNWPARIQAQRLVEMLRSLLG